MSRRRRFGWRAAVVVVVSVVRTAAAVAQSPSVPDNQGVRPPNEAEIKTVKALLAELDRDPDVVVADIGTRSVTRADVAATIRAMPPFLASRPTMELFQDGAGTAIRQRALAVRAADAGLETLPSVASRLRATAEDVLADSYLRGALDANITDDVLRRAADRLVVGKPGPEEVRARIIVTDTEKAAEEAIADIARGASFDAVARSESKDGSAPDGGDLGYVRAEMLAPELAAVLFSLGVGASTAYPVQSGDRWFVLRAEGRRVGQVPTFEEVRPLLAHDLAVIEVAGIKQQAVSDAKIVYHGMLADMAPAEGSR
jgi:peptidyl-prolyl cis-trans isomerase C